MHPKKRKARRLTNLDVDEVSLVDKPANKQPFLIFKREEAEPVEKDLLGADIPVTSADLYADAAEILSKIHLAHASLAADIRKAGGDAAANVSLFDIVKNDEVGHFSEMVDELEKVFGPIPHQIPRSRPFPSAGPAHSLPTEFSAARLVGSVRKALAVPGLPDHVKKPLESVLDSIEKGESMTDPTVITTTAQPAPAPAAPAPVAAAPAAAPAPAPAPAPAVPAQLSMDDMKKEFVTREVFESAINKITEAIMAREPKPQA